MNKIELKGKILNFLGDSITEGYGVENIAQNRFDNILKKTCELKGVNNYGIGGTRIAHQYQPSETPRWDLSFCARARDMDKTADVIVIYGGVNDYFHGDAPFGKIGDSTRETFCGSVDYLIRFLRENYPDALLVFLTPAHAKGDEEPSKSIYKTVKGLPLQEYVRVIEKTAGKYNLPCLSLFDDLGIDPNNTEDYEKYTTDGLHFNDAGHKVLAERIEEFLRNLKER